MRRQGDAQCRQAFGQNAGKVVCSIGAAQEAGQGDGNLNRGKKPGGLLGKYFQFFCFAVAFLGQNLHFGFIQRDHCNLGAGENGVQRNQDDLQQQREYECVHGKIPPKLSMRIYVSCFPI